MYMLRSSSEKLSTSVLTSNVTFAAKIKASGCTLYPSDNIRGPMSAMARHIQHNIRRTDTGLKHHRYRDIAAVPRQNTVVGERTVYKPFE